MTFVTGRNLRKNMSDIKKLKDSVYELEGLLELADRRVPASFMRADTACRGARIEARRTNMFYELKPNVDLSVEHVAPAQLCNPKKRISLSQIAEPVSASRTGKSPARAAVETGDDVEELYVIDDAGPAESVVSVEPQLTVAAAPAAASVRRPVFCLNDRFRFRRALFGGSDARVQRCPRPGGVDVWYGRGGRLYLWYAWTRTGLGRYGGFHGDCPHLFRILTGLSDI